MSYGLKIFAGWLRVEPIPAETYVEVWLEKDAIAGVLVEETDKWDVPLMVTRGYPSLSFVAEAAEAMSEAGRPVHIYYFGDHDPSGVDILRHIEERLLGGTPND